jgi:hypothetical protein
MTPEQLNRVFDAGFTRKGDRVGADWPARYGTDHSRDRRDLDPQQTWRGYVPSRSHVTVEGNRPFRSNGTSGRDPKDREASSTFDNLMTPLTLNRRSAIPKSKNTALDKRPDQLIRGTSGWLRGLKLLNLFSRS